MPPRLYACGSNGEGQLGLGYVSDKVLTPTLVPLHPYLDQSLNQIRTIRGGGNHTLIRTANGDVFAAGSNSDGQIANGVLHASGEAQSFDGQRFLGFEKIHNRPIALCAAAWMSSVMINEPYDPHDHDEPLQIYSTGRGLYGELGCKLEERLRGRVVDLAAGMYHYIALLENGAVWGWGRAKNGQLGETDMKSFEVPTRISDVTFEARKVICGQNFTYVVGDPATGEHIVLGEDKHGIQSDKPEHVKGWKDIGATWNAIFILFQDGTLTAWGKSNLWQLIPPNLPKISQIAVGSDHIVAVTADKNVISWGWASHGNCGDTSKLKEPLVKGYVTGQFNEIEVEGEVCNIGAGYSTTFILTDG